MVKNLLLLTLVILPSLFGKAVASEELSIWIKTANATRHDHFSIFVSRITKTFCKRNKVRCTIGTLFYDDIRSKLIKFTATGSKTPDVVFVPGDFVYLESLARLSTIPNNLVGDRVETKVLDTAKNYGKQLGLPFSYGNHLMLYYNKKLVPKPPRTWEEVVAMRAKFVYRKIDLIQWKFAEPYYFIPFLTAFGGWPLDGEGGFLLNSPSFVDSMAYVKDLKNKLELDPKCKDTCYLKRFGDGDLAMIIDGDWSLTEVRTKLGNDLGVAPIPNVGSKVSRSMFSSMAMLFPNKSLEGTKKKILSKYARYLTSPKVQGKMFGATGSFPVNKVELKKIIESKHKHLSALTYKPLSYGLPMPSDFEMSIAWEAMRRGISKSVVGKMAHKKSAIYMQKFAEDLYTSKKSQARNTKD